MFDGANAGFVYADTADAARRMARAGYIRVHPDRDPDGRVRVAQEGTDVPSEAAEAQRVAAELYEGLRLLPGMELPAEKLRNVLMLLESAVARETGAVSSGVARGGGGGDTEMAEAFRPVLTSKVVPKPVQEKLRSLIEWVGMNTTEEQRRQIEGQAFQTLWEADLIDPRFDDVPACKLYRASAYLSRRLSEAGILRIERFEGAKTIDDLRGALRTYGKEGVHLAWSFVRDTGGPEEIKVRQPLVFVGENQLQKARVMRGVGNSDPQVVALDRALFDTLERLKSWSDHLGRLAEPYLKDKHRQFFERALTRIRVLRKQMAKSAKEDGDVLPTDTARRDLIKFIIDQIHRIQDAMAVLPPDRSLREAFGNLVFKDVVFRSTGAYLTQNFGINIDTAVVEGADTQGLAGRFKKEQGGPKPRQTTTRIHSVVIPCYTQDGATVRQASVRLGIYD